MKSLLKSALKRTASALATVLVFPAACLSGFGRFHEGFVFCAQTLAFAPGIPGSYLRVAFYSLTLEQCGSNNHIAMGSYFSHSRASIGNQVVIGAYCILGHVSIDDDTMIASGAQVLSGANQHVRDETGRLTDDGAKFQRVRVGRNCWIGAEAIIMANIGSQVTVAAGSVVSRDVPDGATVAGNPARVVRAATPEITV